MESAWPELPPCAPRHAGHPRRDHAYDLFRHVEGASLELSLLDLAVRSAISICLVSCCVHLDSPEMSLSAVILQLAYRRCGPVQYQLPPLWGPKGDACTVVQRVWAHATASVLVPISVCSCSLVASKIFECCLRAPKNFECCLRSAGLVQRCSRGSEKIREYGRAAISRASAELQGVPAAQGHPHQPAGAAGFQCALPAGPPGGWRVCGAQCGSLSLRLQPGACRFTSKFLVYSLVRPPSMSAAGISKQGSAPIPACVCKPS